MRILVTGSRDWGYPNLVQEALSGLIVTCLAMGVKMFVRHGACPSGADRAASDWCKHYSVTEEPFPADWSQGVAAGPLRNIRMFDDQVDLVLAFWDGKSKGTKHTIDLAQKRNILTLIRFV